MGFLFLILYPAASASSSSAASASSSSTSHHCHTQLCHTPSFTHNFVTHHLCHTPSFTHTRTHHLTHNFVTHHLSHTTLSHTIFHTHHCHTQLCHTPSFTHSFVTHHLCQTPSFTHTHHLTHTTLSRTIFHTTLSHTIFHTHHCHTQLCHTGTWSHAPRHSCVAGVALGDIQRHFAWQAWHLATSTFVSRGRRGTWRHLPSFSSFTHRFVAHHLSHTTFTHTRSFTQNFVTYTIVFVAHHLSHTTLSRTTLHIQLVLLLDPPPHPLSFLSSPSPLQHLLLIIGRS